MQEPAIVGVPGIPADRRLLGTWTPHHIAVWSPPRARDTQGRDVGYGVCELQWQATRWNRVTRRLASQAHGYFMSLQRQAREEEGVSDTMLVEYSQLYRSSLHECVLGLRKNTRDHMYSEDSPTGHAELEQKSFSMMELVWHLCELLFLDVLPVGCLIQQLLVWVRWHGRDTEEGVRAVLSHPRPDEHPNYWTEVYWLVMNGHMEPARDLLQHHSCWHTMPEVFQSIDDLLRKMPMVRTVASLSRSELQLRWKEWRVECCRRRDSGVFLTVPHLQILARILCGEDEAFSEPEVVDCCTHWYELMAARLLFTCPLVVSSDYDLVCAAEVCMRLFPHCQGSLDAILLAALRNDVMETFRLQSLSYQTFRLCSLFFSNWLFVAHLTNLLLHKNLLATHLDYGEQMSEFFILEYASSLVPHTSLWEVAMDYFSECPLQGRQYMAILLERIPLTSDRKAEKVLSVCDKYNLKEEAKGICRVLATRAYHHDRLGQALSWCQRAKDSAFAAYLAEKYFDHYQSLGEFMDLDLLDHLGASMLLSDKLTFLCKYREFQRLMAAGQFTAAGDLLVRLLLSNTVPRRFWMTLLMDALPLLELENQLVFSVDQTQALQHCLQELTVSCVDSSPDSVSQSGKVPDSVSQNGTVPDSDKVEVLRRSLVHNLSRAMLED